MTQHEALNFLMMGKNVYLTGQAGSGKTYLLNKYIDFLKDQKIGVAVTASTGIAATHINGTTIHAWAGIGIKSNLTNHDRVKIINNTPLRTKIRNTQVLIIDEISMFHSYRLDLVNEVCKLLREDARPFGGIQVILCGDFFQLPPINEAGYAGGSFAYKGKAWEELDLTICYLNEQHRQQDESFIKLLNEIRSQTVSEYTFENLAKRLHKDVSTTVRPTKLYTHNIDVDVINAIELEKIEKPLHTYTMLCSGKKTVVEALKKGCLSGEEVLIKENAFVMFVKNNPAKGYVNGTLGRVIHFDENGYPVVETFTGKQIVASPVSWQFEENGILLGSIHQIPLRLAWAITIHKSQGMSLDAAEIDLSKSFTYGMGYVALSRVRSLEGIRLLGINSRALLVDGEIAEMDESFKKMSRDASSYLTQIGNTVLRKEQQIYFSHIITKEEISNQKDRIKKLLTQFFA